MRQIGPQHVLKLNHVRGRRDVIEVKRSNPIDVLEDARKLPGHGFDLSLGKAQASQLRNVEYLLSLDHGGRF
jgi:hypothetical protein